jgi:hypothetical protein
MHLEIRNNEVYLNGVKQGKLGHIQLEIDIIFEQETENVRSKTK